LNLLIEAIDADRPLSPRLQVLREILAKFGEGAGCRRVSNGRSSLVNSFRNIVAAAP
jgi:hypothetical protein